MRLTELFGDITPEDLKKIENSLDRFVYQPREKMRTGKDVLDLVLPTRGHFMDRIKQRAKDQHISTDEINDLLKRAKIDPSLGFDKKLNQLSRKNDPDYSLTVEDPESKLVIPLAIVPNYHCDPKTKIDGISVCKTNRGNIEPKNKAVAKTIFRREKGYRRGRVS